MQKYFKQEEIIKWNLIINIIVKNVVKKTIVL